MAYLGFKPSQVAVTVGQGVIDASHIEDASITTADLSNDAVTPNQIDDDGTGFQMGSLGLGTAVSGSHKLTVGGTATFSGDITGTLATASQGNITSVGTLSSLTLSGDLTLPQKIVHSGDTDTYLSFGTDSLSLYTGGTNVVDFIYGAVYIKQNNKPLVGYNTGGSARELIKIDGSNVVQIAESSDSNFGGGATFTGTISSSTSSTTDSVLTLTDAGVADYSWTFPDTSTIKMSTNTSSSKVFELKNEGSGFFNLKVEGEIEIQASSDPAIKFNSAEAGADAWYIYSAGSGLKFRNLDDSVTALELTHSNNASFSGTITSGTHLIDGVSNYTGLEVKGSGGSRPQVKWSNVNNGVIGAIYGTESNGLEITSGTNGYSAISISSAQEVSLATAVKFEANAGATRAKLHWYNASTTLAHQYYHLKTDISYGDATQMYSVHFLGHAYNDSKAIDTILTFYNYDNGGVLAIGSTGNHSATVYESSDGKLVMVLNLGAGNTYYSGFTLSQYHTRQGCVDFSVTAISTSNSGSGVY